MQPAGPGTVEDLIADAEGAGHPPTTPRLITDWVTLGLIDKPTLRPLGRGQGSDKALYSANQRNLFLTLLHHRKNVRNMSTLAKIPVAIWIYYGPEYVPLRQARRALKTWLGDYRASHKGAERSGRELLGQLDNPEAAPKARRHLRRTLAHIAYTGELNMTALEAATSEVFEPRISPLRRAVGPPGAFLTVDTVLTLIQARLTAAQLVKNDRVTDAQLQRARRAQVAERAQFDVLQAQLAAQAGPALADMFRPVTFEDKVNTCGADLLTVIGLHLRERGIRVSEATWPSAG